MDFKTARLDAYHQWPAKRKFKAEEKFDICLELSCGRTPLKTAKIGVPKDNKQSIYVGHYLDGLDALPYRPDYMFDHCFKVIDSSSQPRYPGLGLKGVTQGLGSELVNSSPAHWQAITDYLCKLIPNPTLMFIVKRMCSSYGATKGTNKQFAGRVAECIGQKRYAEFINKFSVDDNSNVVPLPDGKRLESACSFLRLYLSGTAGSKKRPGTPVTLNMTDAQNIPNLAKRLEFILSIWLFTMRNERAHGTALSPFRTSKSSLERYESYYYSMLAAYILSLGALSLSAPHLITASEIEGCCLSNTRLQSDFFEKAKYNKHVRCFSGCSS